MKAVLSFGSVEPRTLNKFENGRMVVYGYAIFRDKDGVETHRTEPEALSSMGWDNGQPFTEKDYNGLSVLKRREDDRKRNANGSSKKAWGFC